MFQSTILQPVSIGFRPGPGTGVVDLRISYNTVCLKECGYAPDPYRNYHPKQYIRLHVETTTARRCRNGELKSREGSISRYSASIPGSPENVWVFPKRADSAKPRSTRQKVKPRTLVRLPPSHQAVKDPPALLWQEAVITSWEARGTPLRRHDLNSQRGVESWGHILNGDEGRSGYTAMDQGRASVNGWSRRILDV